MANAAYYGHKPDLPAAAVADADALTSAAITGGEAPTEAEHNALRADLVALRTSHNALLASLRAADVLDS